MAGTNELLIKINADAKNATKAFDDVRKKTEDMEGTLNKASLAGAVVFAALSAEVFLSVRAFSEAEQATNQLTQALQNQGIFTSQLRLDYKGLAEETQRKTGIDDDAITKSQAIAQSYLGQQKVTQELTDAIADLSTKTGSLDSAAQLIGRTIGTSTNALARNGVVIREGSTQAERYTQVLEQLNIQVGGQAAAANKASLGMNGLLTAFGNLQEELGRRFAPAIEAVATRLTSLLEALSKNDALLDFAAAIIAGVAAAAGLVAIAGPLVSGFLAIKAGLLAAGVAAGTLGVALFAIPAAIAVVVAGAVFLALNWERSMVRMRAATSAAITFFTESFGNSFGAIADLLSGKISFAEAMKKMLTAPFQAGIAALKEYDKVTTDGFAAIEAKAKASEEKQIVAKKEAADKASNEKAAQEAREAATRKAQTDLKLLQLRQASQEEIALKQQEVGILKDLETEKNRAVIEASKERLEELKILQEEQHAEEVQRSLAFEEEKQLALQEARVLGIETDSALLEAQMEQKRASLETERSAELAVLNEMQQYRINQRNMELVERVKFGTAYASINKVMHSQEANAARSAAGELANLANSKNATLKEIGKRAAQAQIAIDTAKGAMAVYANFQTAIPFPPVSIPLGIAAAAAITLYGAERISEVNGAAQGALVGGTGSGDTQPFMLEPGELVAPKRNFNEVVNGVQTERSGVIEEIRDSLGRLAAGGQQGATFNFNGDMYGEDSFVDRMVERLTDAVVNRNARLVASEVPA